MFSSVKGYICLMTDKDGNKIPAPNVIFFTKIQKCIEYFMTMDRELELTKQGINAEMIECSIMLPTEKTSFLLQKKVD